MNHNFFYYDSPERHVTLWFYSLGDSEADAIELGDENDHMSPPQTSTSHDQPLQTPCSTAITPQSPSQPITEPFISPTMNRKRSAFTIENIMGHHDSDISADDSSPNSKKQRNDIFDSIPSPPPKIADIHSSPVVGVPPLSGHMYNPFLLNLATRNSAAMYSSNTRSSLGLIPVVPPPFLHPSLTGFSVGQSIL